MGRLPLGGWEYGLTPETINNFRQNSPELIIRDARRLLGLTDAECDVLRNILLARGVNKWLKARRDIIKLKNTIKERIIQLSAIYNKKDIEQKATLKLLNWFRQELRTICHQPRWVEFPPIANVQKADKYLVIKGKKS